MDYQILPIGDIWKDGIFCVPRQIVSKSLNFADDAQLRILLMILANDGKINENEIAASLRLTVDEVMEKLDFWVSEGILCKNGETAEPMPAAIRQKEVVVKKFEALPVPNLSPKDIVAMCRENGELTDLLRNAQEILGSSLSSAMQGSLINMVTYYGLPVPVVLTLLSYYKNAREGGKNITTRNLQNMAREWADEEILTLDAADKKLKELEVSDELWNRLISLAEFEFRKPNASQRKMIKRWSEDFSNEMIIFACNTMKKYTEKDKQSFKAIDNILKDWQKKGFKNPEDVKSYRKEDNRSSKKKGSKLKSEPSFDIDEIAKKAMFDDNYDI